MERIKLGEPEIGGWYRDLEGRLFEVVACDDHEGAIDIQHYDGTVEELDAQDWLALLAQPAEPPEDCSGAMDLESDGLSGEFDGDGEPGWQDPLDRLDRM